MKIKLNYIKTTRNFVNYETDQDFKLGEPVCRIWIPIKEIETNIPGVFPESIWIEVKGD
jgi:hypothetical protein